LIPRHRKVPDGHLGYRDGGWRDFHVEPMKARFARPGPTRRSAHRYSATRQGERSFQLLSASVAQAVVLSAWQTLQAFGTFRLSVRAG
jgi:hypothetical protein